MKRLGLVALLIGCLAAVGGSAAAAGSAGAYRGIVVLESKRSLGDGRLARDLGSADPGIAARAALAIGRTKQPAGAALLAAHLHDARVPVRALSVYGLGLLATGDDLGSLLAALHDPAGAVRVAAVDALARYQAARRLTGSQVPIAERALLSSLESDESPIVRARAATALVEFAGVPGGTAAAGLERAFRSDQDLGVRWHAMWTIYRGYARHAGLALLESALHDRSELVRIQAVRALGARGGKALVPVLAPLLADPSWRVQEQTIVSIRALENKPPIDHWKTIPAFVHVPAAPRDPLASLPALPWPAVPGQPSAPQAGAADLRLQPFPTTAQQMTQPVAGAHPRVRIVTTKGNLYGTLFPEWAPLTVENFLTLAARGYYNGNPWFRIVPDFVVQTGDPHGNGEGDAGYSIPAEENPIEQDGGVISMGLNYDDKTQTPIRDSAGTQYYITLSPQLHLDRDFTVFGRVTGGGAVLGRLVESDRVLKVQRIADAVVRSPNRASSTRTK
jgi:cyclophilin family peptidyl-prolyl cis-trans isomerase/HEAT repeat protein